MKKGRRVPGEGSGGSGVLEGAREWDVQRRWVVLGVVSRLGARPRWHKVKGRKIGDPCSISDHKGPGSLAPRC